MSIGVSLPVLDRLDPTTNGVNRFISSSLPLERKLVEYLGIRKIRIASNQELAKLALELANHQLNDLLSLPAGAGEAALLKVLGIIFRHPEVLLGADCITDQTLALSNVVQTIASAVNQQKPLKFTLLGFPHKMPNPLYSRSRRVDFSDIFALAKLKTIAERIADAYQPGIQIKVLTENSIFHQMSDISDDEHLAYFVDLRRWTQRLTASDVIQVEDITEYHTEELEARWIEMTAKIKRAFTQNDPETVDMVASVLPTNFMTLNYRDFDTDFLFKLFDRECQIPEVEKVREKMYSRALEESFGYLAYHQARYQLGFMDSVFPESLRLTVAPKLGSFGINLLGKSCSLLPYYGYVLRDGKCFTIKYISDIPASATCVYQEREYSQPALFENL